MTVTVCYTQERERVSVFKVTDGRRRRITLYVPWAMPLTAILAAAIGDLTLDEFGEVADALGVDRTVGDLS